MARLCQQDEIIEKTRQKYLEAYRRLTGKDLC